MMLASSAPEAPEAIRAIVVKSTSSAHLNLLGVNLENVLPALEIRQLYRYPAVKTAGTQSGRDPGNPDGWWRPES